MFTFFDGMNSKDVFTNKDRILVKVLRQDQVITVKKILN